MALRMQHTDRYGNEHAESYWMIARLDIDFLNRVAHVTVAGFKDKAARDSMKCQPVESMTVAVNGDDFDVFFAKGADNVTAAYQMLKTTKTVQHPPKKETRTVTLASGAKREEVHEVPQPATCFWADAQDV